MSHFAQAVEPAAISCPVGELCLPKKKSRSVCFGGESKCGTRRGQVAGPKGFDLLVTFEFGSDRLSPLAQANLTEFAKALNGAGMIDKSFRIEGHTDARGADRLNMVLSERRAAIVVEYLRRLGVDGSRLHAQGFGESRPRLKSDPFAGINRRVEANIYAK